MVSAMMRAARAFYLLSLVILAMALLIPGLRWAERIDSVWGEGRVLQVAAGLALLGVLSEHVLGGVTRMRQATLSRALQRVQPALRHKDAIQILIRALESQDAQVTNTAHRELKRLTRQDLPADAAAWRGWLKEEEKAAVD